MTSRELKYDRDLVKLLTLAIKSDASDVHIKSDYPIRLRVHGNLKMSRVTWNTDRVTDVIKTTMSEEQWETFSKTLELDYGLSIPYNDGRGETVTKRFRVNAFYSKNAPGIILRLIPSEPPSLEGMGLPNSIFGLAEEKAGLILVVGATGSGKTTTIAGILDHINSNRRVNIITLEDPIEFVHQDKKASVVQREVGIDTLTFASGLKSILRQDPDVILLGELRDQNTVRTALEAANTGHLVLATLHATTAIDAIGRVIDMFHDPAEKHQVRLSMSDSLRGVVAQKLLPKVGGGRVAALEVLLNVGRVPRAIADPLKGGSLEDIMKEGERQYDMQTLETHLYTLVDTGLITAEDAVNYANQSHDLKLRLRTLSRQPLRVQQV